MARELSGIRIWNRITTKRRPNSVLSIGRTNHNVQVSMKSVDYFCSNPAHRQNDGRNDRQTDVMALGEGKKRRTDERTDEHSNKRLTYSIVVSFLSYGSVMPSISRKPCSPRQITFPYRSVTPDEAQSITGYCCCFSYVRHEAAVQPP